MEGRREASHKERTEGDRGRAEEREREREGGRERGQNGSKK